MLKEMPKVGDKVRCIVSDESCVDEGAVCEVIEVDRTECGVEATIAVPGVSYPWFIYGPNHADGSDLHKYELVEAYADTDDEAPSEPSKASEIRQACDSVRDLLIRKNHDYGDSFAQQYAKYGLQSALIRMDDKMRRLETLADGAEAQVAESIEDTLADLAGYALLALVEARK